MNGDGFVDKKEFKRMTNSKKINNRIIDLVFEVRQKSNSSIYFAFHSSDVTGIKMENLTLMSSGLL